MAFSRSDFLYEDDIDAVFAVIDADIVENDNDIGYHVAKAVEEIPVHDQSHHQCQFCEKICLSKGLKKHVGAKHKEQTSIAEQNEVAAQTELAEQRLPPSLFQDFVKKSTTKLLKDECYLLIIRNKFQCIEFSLDYVMPAYVLNRDMLVSFDGDMEKFYPKFYDLFSTEPFFEKLDQQCTMLLTMDLANLALSHITGDTILNDKIEFF